MKVNAFREIFRFSPTLKTQGEGEGYGSGRYDGQHGQQGQQGGHPDAKNPPDAAPELNEAEQLQAVQAALDDFSKDSATQSQGLSARLSTEQPGLSVVLSDVNGNVIRSFSGSEFVRLRKGGSQDNRGRGKLLDQKY